MAAKKQSFTLEDVSVQMNGNIVGGIQSVSIKLDQENKPLHEGGSKFPREIMDGQVTVSGSVEKLFLDVETIKSLIDLEDGNNPYFNLVGVTKNKNPERKITVVDAKFKGLALDLALTDETKAAMDYDALRIKLN